MKKYLLFLAGAFLVFFFSSNAFSQVCIPGTDTSKLFSPDTLGTVFVGQPYNQVVYVHVPHDTTINFVGIEVLVYIDSVRLDSVKGLPKNFSYACNPVNCTIKGDANACLLISGLADASQVGNYILNGSIFAYLFDGISFHFTYTIPVDSLYILKVRIPTGISTPLGSSLSVSNVYPSPADDEIYFYLTMNKPVEFNWSISDLSGRQVLSGAQNEPGLNHAMSFDVSKLNSGQYLLQLNSKYGSLTRTFFKQ